MIYAGMFAVAFSVLACQIALVRILSVTSWYHLAFFAISTAMLGMTAGSVRVYLSPKRFSGPLLTDEISRACFLLAISMPGIAAALCLLPLGFYRSAMSFFSLLLTTGVCALPFYYAGTVVTAVLTKVDRPISNLYASDLTGASLGCLGVLAGLEHMDAPSVVVLSGAACAFGGFCFSRYGTRSSWGTRDLVLCVLLVLFGLANASTSLGIRPLVVKGREIEPESMYEYAEWNSYSRIAVYPREEETPQYWAAGKGAPQPVLPQYRMNIDGDAGTVMRRFSAWSDIEHLRYDLANVGHQLGRKGEACVIGVGGGRDIQSALLYNYDHVTGIEINPIFVELLENRFREFAGIGNRADVTLVADEARSYLSSSAHKYAFLQMSLIDTWAATGAGAYSLSENSLYTTEAWKVFLKSLQPDGVFTVSRWHKASGVSETGRVVSLGVNALLNLGIEKPERHIVLITGGRIATLLLSPQPFSSSDIEKLEALCTERAFTPVLMPGRPPALDVLGEMTTARSPEQLRSISEHSELNYAAPTDENPYFFHMLRLGGLIEILTSGSGFLSTLVKSRGALRGNLVATLTLASLILALAFAAALTIIIPLLLRLRANGPGAVEPPLWWGAAYFALIGAGFMYAEIALIQRLSVLLSHPIYALGILLFTLIASTGLGSFLSGKLPLRRSPWQFLLPVTTVIIILMERFLLSYLLDALITSSLGTKILLSIVAISPLGLFLGCFFPTGLELVRHSRSRETPWYLALNGVFGVLCSGMAVFVSIYAGVSVNFYLSAACYAGLIPAVYGLSSRD